MLKSINPDVLHIGSLIDFSRQDRSFHRCVHVCHFLMAVALFLFLEIEFLCSIYANFGRNNLLAYEATCAKIFVFEKHRVPNHFCRYIDSAYNVKAVANNHRAFYQNVLIAFQFASFNGICYWLTTAIIPPSAS